MRYRDALVTFAGCLLLAGCAQSTARLADAPRLLDEVAAAPARPVQLAPTDRQAFLKFAEAAADPRAKAMVDPELSPDFWASFWRSPLNGEVHRNSLLLVRYRDDGSYVYLGVDRDGSLFTSGTGGLWIEPPWSQ